MQTDSYSLIDLHLGDRHLLNIGIFIYILLEYMILIITWNIQELAPYCTKQNYFNSW